LSAGSGSGAIFTEVLSIGIDTSLFEAQLKQVEALYAASLNRMPNLGQIGVATIGPEMQKAATQFTAAAKQIENAATSVTQDVGIMVAQSNANMAAMATAVQKTAAKTKAAMSEGEGAVTRFGNAVERAAFRVPAMVLVGSAMIGMLELIKAPIDFVEKGFDNIANKSIPFKQATTEFTEGITRVASITATPIFDLILNAMQRLNGWLKENGVWIDQVAVSLGKLVSTDLSVLTGALDKRPTGLIETINTALTAMGYLIATVKALSSLAFAGDTDDQKMDKLQKDGAKRVHELKAQGLTDSQVFYKLAEEQRQAANEREAKQLNDQANVWQTYFDEINKITQQSVELTSSANGAINNKVPTVPGINEGQTSQELAQEFRNKLSLIKTHADEQKKVIEGQANAEVISRRAAFDQIKPILEAERDEVKKLIDLYQNKMLGATDITNIGNSKARTKQLALARGSLGGRGEFNQTFNDQESAEKQKADKEELDIHRITKAAELKVDQEHYAAEIALIHKSVQEGHDTRERGVIADIELENKRHTDALIANNVDKFGPGTVAAARQQAAIKEENARHDETEKKNLAALTEARRQDLAALNAQNAALTASAVALREVQAQEAAAVGNKRLHIQLTKEIIALKLAEAQAELTAARIRAQVDSANPVGSQAYLNDQKEIERLKTVIAQLQKQAADGQFSNSTLGRQERSEDSGTPQASAGDKIKDALGIGDGSVYQQDMKSATTTLEKFAAGAEGVATVFTSIVGTVNQAIDAYKKGGVLGAAGSLLSSGPLSDALSAIPVVGAFVKPFGQVLSAVSSLFSANIQRIVNDINTKVADINQQASLGNLALKDQITELQQEKQDAISQLGGSKKKGAKSQLDAILKSLNVEIAQLQKQQTEIITNFNQMVAAASLGSSVMTDWYTTWTQINQQVKQYVDAGGSLSTAAQFLNQQLQQQQQKLQDSLNSGNQTAIGDAIQLNTLIAQRVQMIKDEAATEFGLINSDSMERRTSNAVKLGTELSKQRAQYALQLQDTNNQIDLENMKVDAEGKIFSINKSIAELQADSNRLTLAALNEQLQKYKDMQTLLANTNGFTYRPGNVPTGVHDVNGIPGEPSVAGTINFNGGITITGSGNPSQDANTLMNEIRRNIRAGRSGF
jgi:hypothetical protein